MILARVAAVVVMFLALIACGMQGLAIVWASDHAETTGSAAGPWAAVVCTFAAGLGLAVVLETLYQIGLREPHSATPAKADNTGTAIQKLAGAMVDFRDHLPAAVGRSVAEAMPAAASPQPVESVLSPALEQHLAQMVRLLEEMKEVSMLDETQRKARRQQVADRRKFGRLEESARLIARHDWEQADAVLTLLESLFPGDADVLRRRNELDDARNGHMAADWEQVTRLVEDQMALSRYDDAIEFVTQFVQKYPTYPPAIALADRVRQERDIATEKTVNRLYDQIRNAVEARQWRSALDSVQQFFARFPNHPRTEKMRPQLRVIQKNAEIEERHDGEIRMGELIKGQRYDEAIQLGQDLLARFPESPQAAALAGVVARLQERVATAG